MLSPDILTTGAELDSLAEAACRVPLPSAIPFDKDNDCLFDFKEDEKQGPICLVLSFARAMRSF